MKNNHLLATEQMYRPVANEGFNAAQAAFFKRQLSTYAEQSSRHKWEWVLARLSDALPPTDKRLLSDFKLSREQIKSTNTHVLSLEQCLRYFESIYFLHQTDDPVFQLNANAKKKILSLLQKPLAPADDMCEAGRFNRFEEIITEFRADFDWVTLHLAQHRELTLLRLHDQYNADFNVADSYKVHVLGVMRSEAIQKKLGLSQHQQLDDIYMRASFRKSIVEYFHHHYEAFFLEYEQKAIQSLSQALFLKITDHLKRPGTKDLEIPGGVKLQLMPTGELNQSALDSHTLYLYQQDEGIFAAGVLGDPFQLPHSQLGEHAAGILQALQPRPKKTLSLHRHNEQTWCFIQKGNTKPTRAFLTSLPFEWGDGDSAKLSLEDQSVLCHIKKKEGTTNEYALNKQILGEHADTIMTILNEPTTQQLSVEQEALVFKIAATKGYMPEGVQINTFLEYIRSHLRLPKDMDIKHDFTLWADSACIDLRLKPQSVCLKRLSDLIEAMLLKKGYFIPNTMIPNNLTFTFPHKLRLKQGITRDVLRNITQSFQRLNKTDMHQVRTFILKHRLVFSWYPSILLNWIESPPYLGLALPFPLNNEAKYIDAAIAGFYTQIRYNLRHFNQHRHRLNDLLTIIRHEKAYFKEIPADLLAHRAIALSVVSNNGLSLYRLPSPFNDDEEVVQAAIKNDCFSIFFASNRLQHDATLLQLAANGLSKRWERTVLIPSIDDYRTQIITHYARLCADLFKLNLKEWVPFDASQPLIRENFKTILADTNHFKAIDAMHALVTIPFMSTRQWIYFTQEITPQMLQEIISVRARHHKIPLPYCNHSVIFSDFYQALSAQDLLNTWASNSYHETKRQASLRARGHLIPKLMTDLTTTKYWGLMYMRYQYQHFASPFQNWGQISSQLNEINNTRFSPFYKISAFVVTSLLVACYCDEQKRPSPLVVNLSPLLALGLLIIGTELYYKRTYLFVFKLLITLYSPTNTGQTEKRLAFRCEESIFRLQGMDNHAAQLKADHLEAIWDSILAESIDIKSVTDESLLPYLNKKYPVLKEGSLHRLSFFDVAAIPRKTELNFPITAPTHRFFESHRTTKTIQMLTADHPEWASIHS